MKKDKYNLEPLDLELNAIMPVREKLEYHIDPYNMPYPTFTDEEFDSFTDEELDMYRSGFVSRFSHSMDAQRRDKHNPEMLRPESNDFLSLSERLILFANPNRPCPTFTPEELESLEGEELEMHLQGSLLRAYDVHVAPLPNLTFQLTGR